MLRFGTSLRLMLLPVTHLTLRVVRNCRIAAIIKWWNERFVNSATRRILHNTSCSCCSLLFQFSTSTTITATVCDCSHLSFYILENAVMFATNLPPPQYWKKIFVITRTIYCTSGNQQCMTTLLEMVSYYVQNSFPSFIRRFLLKCSGLFKSSQAQVVWT